MFIRNHQFWAQHSTLQSSTGWPMLWKWFLAFVGQWANLLLKRHTYFGTRYDAASWTQTSPQSRPHIPRGIAGNSPVKLTQIFENKNRRMSYIQNLILEKMIRVLGDCLQHAQSLTITGFKTCRFDHDSECWPLGRFYRFSLQTPNIPKAFRMNAILWLKNITVDTVDGINRIYLKSLW